MKEKLHAAIAEALDGLGCKSSFSVEYPRDASHGDYATNAALLAGNELGKRPIEAADFLKHILELKQIPGVAAITIAGPGFINFRVTPEHLATVVKGAIKKDTSWGTNDTRKKKRIVVDYTDPNLFKPLHIGHVMNNALGESITRLFEASGARVIRINYQADIGLHVAKALWGAQAMKADIEDIFAVGKAYAFGHERYEIDPKAKKEITALNTALYRGDDTALMALYGKGRKSTLAYFARFYPVLGTRFDADIFESETGPLGKSIVEKHIGTVFEKSDGAVVFRGEQYGLHTRVFITKEGNPTYEAKDVGLAAIKKKRYPFDLTVSVTSLEQKEYFRVVIRAIEAVYPDLAGKIEHCAHGFLTLTTGKMSSRKGNVVTGEELIEDMRAKARERMKGKKMNTTEEAAADAVAVAAIKYAILRQGSGKNIVFDPEQAFSLEGDSGPYLQYAHTRAVSLLKKAKTERVKSAPAPLPEAPLVLRLIPRFPEVVARAAQEKEPHFVTTYLTELAGAFNSWYGQEQIVDKGDPRSPAKVALVDAFRSTMKNGLFLLGMQAPEVM